MAKAKKTWREKLHDSKGLPKVVKLTKAQSKKMGAETLAIPSPEEIDEIMRKVPKGKLITINEMRRRVAIKHDADAGCPITTGIFAWIAAYAAEEERAEGKKRITPYWRTLKLKGEINPKYPGGLNSQIKHLLDEGFEVIVRGKKTFVSGYEKFLVKL